MPELHLKPVKLENKEAVLILFKEAALSISKKGIDHWQYWLNPPREKLLWVENGIKNKEFFFIINNSQETIGMIQIMDEDPLYWGKQQDKAKYLHSFVIKEAFGGNGVGKKVLQHIAEQATRENCKYLRLDADANNTGLCLYYEKQGFKKIGEKQGLMSVNNLYEKALS